MNRDKTQVLILSHQTLFRRGIEHALAQVPDIQYSSMPEFNEALIASIDALPPDVAIIDIDGSSDAGLALSRKFKQRSPNIALIVLTTNLNDSQLFQALKGQAAAYLDKEVTAEALIETVKRVSRGEHPINESLTTRPRVAEQVLKQFQELSWRSEADAFISPLTARETEILNYIARGFLNKQIAAELTISEQTIKNHVTSILRKLNANARTEAVVVGIRQGLITIT
ncbi:MAG: response regulator transcription factor [Chloroflexi bacterium]|nr:response regulator transcription factor [Chloroflexota bacterium]